MSEGEGRPGEAPAVPPRRSRGRRRSGVAPLAALGLAALAALALRALAAPGPMPPVAGGRGGGRSDLFAAIQFTPARGQVEANRDRLGALVRQAAAAGARYVVLPELATTGPLDGVAPVPAEEVPGPTTRFFGRLAEELGLWIAVSLPVQAAAGGGYHVSTVLLDDRGEVLARQAKVLPRYGGGDGPALRGDPRAALASFDDHGRRIGVLSGDDLLAGLPELASRGAETVLVAAAWGAGEPVAWEEQCRRLSREHRVNLVIAAAVEARAGGAPGPPALGGIFDRAGERVEEIQPSAAGSVGSAGSVARAALAAPDGWVPATPRGLPSLPVPVAAPLTPQLVELGRTLFFDRSLSRDGSVSCATCHQPERAFSNGERSGAGIGGQRTRRNVPSLLNVAFRGALFWDGYAGTLESQAKYPLSHAAEMDSPYLDRLLDHLRASPGYADRFRAAFGRGEIGYDEVARALAAYERLLVSADSPFDRYFYGGQQGALAPAAERGLGLFLGKAGCASCHLVGDGYALFMDGAFHDTGVGWDPAAGAFADGGLGLLSDASRNGQFLTPSLRDVAATAPYMHDGSLASLEEVVAFYDRGGNPNPGRDPRIHPLGLSARERADLVSFLRSLSGSRSFSAAGLPVDRRAAWDVPPAEPVRFAAVRYAPVPGQAAANRAALAALIERAVRQGAGVVVLPEHAETGRLAGLAPAALRALAEREGEASRAFFAELARRHGIWIAAPGLEAGQGAEGPFQTTVLFDPDGAAEVVQRKLFPWPERGDGAAARGELRRLRAVPTPAGWLGVLAGDDLRAGVPRLAELGAETILVSASWRRGDGIDWNGLAAGLAAAHRVNLVVSNLEAEGREPGSFIALADAAGRVSRVEPPPGFPVVSVSLARRPATAVPPLGLPVPPAPAAPPAPPAPITALGGSGGSAAIGGSGAGGANGALGGSGGSGGIGASGAAADAGAAESIALGRRLFFDPALSADGTVSCASCHRPELAFSDGRRVARGVAGRAGQRNTPSLLNVAYRPYLFWDGRARTLEEQVRHAVQGWFEMAADADAVLDRIRRQPSYRRAFRRVTGGGDLRWQDVAAALASFERTLVSGGSPFDRWYYGGDETALSARAKRGFRVFAGAGRCASCHTVGERYALLTDNAFHNTGIGYQERFEYLGYGGDGVEGNLARDNSFRGEYLTPTLRNVALTAPYMHDGSLATLDEVVDFYARGARPNPHLDPRLRPLALSARDKADLVEFLRSLTGDPPPLAGAPRLQLAAARRQGTGR